MILIRSGGSVMQESKALQTFQVCVPLLMRRRGSGSARHILNSLPFPSVPLPSSCSSLEHLAPQQGARSVGDSELKVSVPSIPAEVGNSEQDEIPCTRRQPRRGYGRRRFCGVVWSRGYPSTVPD